MRTEHKSPYSKCRSCGQEIFWTVTTRGKKMPVDAGPSQAGDFFLFSDGERIEAVHMRSDDERVGRALGRHLPRYVSHFSTCLLAAQHRRPR